MPAFHLVNVTWGENHTGLYLDVSLPTQLSPNNLAAFADRPGSVYKIYTTAVDAERIRAHASYRRLALVMPTQIVEVELTPGVAMHDVLTACQTQAIREAEAVGAAIIFLAPDTALGDGAFASLVRLADAGKKAVMVPGVRVAKESFVPAFRERFCPHGGPTANVGPRELCDLALDHLHPTAKALFWPSKVNWPSNLYWSVGREGFVCRCFHLHPMMVVATEPNISFASTIDGDYVERACANPNDVYVVPDSDELTIFEISSVEHQIGSRVRRPLSASAVGRWGALFANRMHRWMFGFVTRIHRVECSPEWDVVQAQSDRDVHEARRWLRCWAVLATLVAPLRPARRAVRKALGGDTFAGRALRWPPRFAARVVKRGPRKALRLARGLVVAESRPNGPIQAELAPQSVDATSPTIQIPTFDPTTIPPPSYTKARAEAVYGEAFRRAFEYLKGTGVTGDIAEFGTLHGYTARLMATLVAELDLSGELWLYDSFTGLPAMRSAVDLDSYEVRANKTWSPGAMAVIEGTDAMIRNVLSRILPGSRVHVVKGYFEQTLPRTKPAEPLALVHLDCDLYASAKFVLDALLEEGALQDGTVLLCDDYNCNRGNPQMGERRALAEAFGGQSRYSYSPYFSYGWHGQAFLIHDHSAVSMTEVAPLAAA